MSILILCFKLLEPKLETRLVSTFYFRFITIRPCLLLSYLVGEPVQNPNVRTHAPITQGEFLIRLGIETRVINLLQKMKDEEKAGRLLDDFARCVGAIRIV